MTTDTADTNAESRTGEVDLTDLFHLMPTEYSRELENLLYSYGLTVHCMAQAAQPAGSKGKTVTCETCKNFSTSWMLGDDCMTRDGKFKPVYIQPLINALGQHGKKAHA